MLQDLIENPHSSANHIVMGMNKDQRDKARGLEEGKELQTWI